MQNPGFEEGQQTTYDPGTVRGLVGQVRRWGPAGPAYEVIGIDDDGNAVCEVVYSGERVSCPVSEVMQDPMAETIP